MSPALNEKSLNNCDLAQVLWARETEYSDPLTLVFTKPLDVTICLRLLFPHEGALHPLNLSRARSLKMETAGDLLTFSARCWERVNEKLDDCFVSFLEFLFFFVIVLCALSHLLFSSNSPKTTKKRKLLLADESKTVIVMMSFKLAELCYHLLSNIFKI